MLVLSRTPTRRFVSAVLQRRSYAVPAGGDPPNKLKYIPTSGTYPKGFLVGSAHAGVKPSNTKYDDLALLASTTPCSAAAVFTTNAFKAAPVTVSSEILRRYRGEDIRSIVVNSGCANAVTGLGGLEDAIAMAKKTDEVLGVEPTPFTSETAPSPSNIAGLDDAKSLVMSTGVIGQRLPISKIIDKIPTLHASLGSTHDHWLRTARAICTTDTFPKLISRNFTLPSHPDTIYTIAGMTKGAGMIHPNMATLLSMIATDCNVKAKALRQLLVHATKTSFNCISIDGDTSTNDTCALLANGAAAPPDAPPITLRMRLGTLNSRPQSKARIPRDTEDQSEDYRAFQAVLTSFMTDLAKLVVRDGEGATKFVTVRVKGAKGPGSAHNIANSIVRSPLVKTALYGKDANWGRILCAIGYSSEKNHINPQATSVSFVPTDGSRELKLVVRGEPQQVDEVRAKEILELEDLEILVVLDDVAPGNDVASANDVSPDYVVPGDEPNSTSPIESHKGEATVWTCDLSHEYVTINGDYRT